MTPLAHRILANQLKPVKRREVFLDQEGVLSFDLASATCFEISAIREFCEWQAEKMSASLAPWPTLFLPAPITWLEFERDGRRMAIVLEALNEQMDQFDIAYVHGAGGVSAGRIGAYRGGLSKWPRVTNANGQEDKEAGLGIVAMLAAINAPKVFARVEHDPHAGLARKLAASKAMPGKYPLHAWHEIKLEGWMPKVEHGTRRAKGATGEKAQHFVRAHPRFQNGKWVIVKWHRRGNPELGMRRARYSVQMPNSTA